MFFGEAVSIAVFCLRNNLIQTFAGFDFLFIRLFGGAVRPLNPSLFAAALFHPDLAFSEEDMARELNNAMIEHLAGWDTQEPVWFPNLEKPPTSGPCS